MVRRTYLEHGSPVTVLLRWGPPKRDTAAGRVAVLGTPSGLSIPRTGTGPKNVLVERADGSRVVRPFRGLRLPPPGPALPAARPAQELTASDAEWIRAHVWTPSMRDQHRTTPHAAAVCACQAGRTTACTPGGPGTHAECHRATPLPMWEAIVCDRSGRALYHARPHAHPTTTATGAHLSALAMVWLADRRCQWVCTCPCHTPAATARSTTEHAAPPLYQRVTTAAGGRCECIRCPQHAGDDADGRCAITTATASLIVSPVHPTGRPELDAHSAELVAWCPACWDRAAARARKAAQARAHFQMEQQEALF